MGDEAYNDEVLTKYRDACDKVIQEFNGHIAQYLGDGIVAYFGSPEAHEDDARNAVSSGLRIVEEVSRLEVPGRQVQVRVGIHTGLAFMSQGRAVGETPALAARVQEAAQPNTALITEATRRQVAGFFHLEEQAARQLKGFSRTTRLYCVRASKGVRSRLEAAATLGLTPFVGRSSEMERLSTCWKKVQGGTRQIVELCGEAGIGKSRLVKVLKEQIADPESVLECSCTPYYQTTAFYPLIDLLERELGFIEDVSREKSLQRLKIWLSSLKVFGPYAVPILADLLSLPNDRHLTADLTSHKRRQLTLNILAEVLTARASQHPLLFVVEDLHWADPSTLELIEKLVGLKDKVAMLSCLTYRPQYRPTWGKLRERIVVELDRLPREESETMVARVTGRKTLPTEVVEQVIARAEGVPLFVEEVTKAVLESGVLREQEDRYELAGPMPNWLIPDTVEESLAARIDQTGHAKPLAQIAATLGREFTYKLIVAVSRQSGRYHRSREYFSSEADVKSALGKLEEAGLIFCVGIPPRAVYTFKHALIRDAAYSSIPRKTKQDYHKRIADRLKSRFPQLGESQPELLATHFKGAGLTGEAIGYWQRAGDRARERAANREAIKHLDMALKELKSLPDTRDSQETELHLQLSLMPAQMAIRGWASQEVEACCVRARELCIALDDHQHLFGALWGLWTVYLVRGELQEALVVAMQVLEMALAAREKILEVMGHHAVGFTRYFRGELLEAKQHAIAGIRFFELETEKYIVNTFQFSSTMALRFFLSASLWLLGSPKESQQELAKASSLIAVLKHAPSSAAFMAYKLCFYLYSRDPQSMRTAAAELIELSEAEGFQLYVPVGMMYSGWARVADGEIEEGLKQIERGLTDYRATGSFIKYVEVMVMYTEALQKAGRTEDALHALEEGMRHASTHEEHLLESELYRIRGEIRLGQDREGDAAEDLDRAIEIARSQSAVFLELRGVVSKCRLLRAQGEKHEAQWQLRKLYDSFTEGFYTKDLIEAKNLLDELSAP